MKSLHWRGTLTKYDSSSLRPPFSPRTRTSTYPRTPRAILFEWQTTGNIVRLQIISLSNSNGLANIVHGPPAKPYSLYGSFSRFYWSQSKRKILWTEYSSAGSSNLKPIWWISHGGWSRQIAWFPVQKSLVVLSIDSFERLRLLLRVEETLRKELLALERLLSWGIVHRVTATCSP